LFLQEITEWLERSKPMNVSKMALQATHQGGLVRTAGESLGVAKAAMLMVHGRGASAEDILSLAEQLDVAGFAYFAPQASNNTWYPNSFLSPISENEPWLSSALEFMGEVLGIVTKSGITPEHSMILGFSQGACLTLEYSVRHTQRYGGLVGLSGALIGPDTMLRDYSGSLAGTPVFLGCSDVDFHVPKERVDGAAAVLGRLGGDVTERLYPNMAHTVNQDEIDFVRGMMQSVLAGI
jgi:phospholipase/carboxylesterase